MTVQLPGEVAFEGPTDAGRPRWRWPRLARPAVAWPTVALPDVARLVLLPRYRSWLVRAAGAGAGTVGLFGVVVGAEVLVARRRVILPETDYERVLRFPGRDAGAGSPLKLVVLGDSTTTGVGTDRVEETYAALVGAALAERGPVEVHVLGHASARATDVLSRQVPLALAVEPDLVLLVVGANDATHVTPFREVRASVNAILDHLAEVPVVLAGVPQLGLVTVLAHPLRELSDWRGQDLLDGRAVQALTEDAGEPSRGRRLGRRVEVQRDPLCGVHLGGHEERRLALVDPLQRVGVEVGGQRRHPLGVVKQCLQTQLPRGVGELLDDLGQPRRQGRRAHVCGLVRTGSAVRSIGTRTALPHSTQEPS